jgi:hypothetical protein
LLAPSIISTGWLLCLSNTITSFLYFLKYPSRWKAHDKYPF